MSISKNWQLGTPLTAIIFDCDSTLSTIEGIDELAKENHVGKEVEKLTFEAMSVSGMNPGLYQKRLELIRPSKKQVIALGKTYFNHLTPDTIPVIQLLQQLNKSIYIVSAGVNPAITIFGELLQIPKNNIYAVDLEFDRENNFQNYDKHSLLVHHDGKCRIVSQIKKQHEKIAFIGDGLTDLDTQTYVTRFIGFGGAVYREKIAKQSQFYINTPSLASLLPLILTEKEVTQLNSISRKLYEQGLTSLYNGDVLIKV